MSKQIESNSRFYVFLAKSAACFFCLMLGFFILSPKASMQDEDTVTVSNKMVGNVRMNGNYKPTPEPPKSTIRGRVIYADTGRPVRRAGLMLMSAKGFVGGRENVGLTNERGEFEIKNVAEGRYFVSVSTPGVLTPFSSLNNLERVGAMQDSSEMANIAKDFQEVVTNGINDTDVTVVVKRGAAITGRIMYADGEAAIGVRVEMLRKKNGQYNAVVPNISEIFGAMFGAAGGLKTDDRGVFRIAGLPVGEYIVRVVENVSHSDKKQSGDDEFIAMSGFNPNSMVATYYPNTEDEKKAEVIKLEIGQEQPEVNITIPDRTLYNLSGVVVSKATRETLKNARVSIKRKDDVNSLFSNSSGFGARNETDEQGRWNYKELPAGKYTLSVQPPYSYESSAGKNPQKLKMPKLSPFEKEIVIEEKDISDLTVELGYGATVSGTISFENGQNLPARMLVSVTEEEGKSAETDYVGDRYSDGSTRQPKKSAEFKVEGLPTGKFYLNVSPTLYDENEKSEPFYVKSILSGGKDITDAMLETKESEDLKGVQIILSNDVGTIKGKVLNDDKIPAVGAKIYFVPTDKQKWGNLSRSLFAATNGDGEFETSGAPGEYFVVFFKDEDFKEEENKDKSVAQQKREWLEKQTANAQKVTVKAKETEKITLTLPKE